MMTKDEAVAARVAALKLERLYHAYRATSRANAMVLIRIRAELDRSEPDPARAFRLGRRIVRETAVSRESDSVFAQRTQQIERRIAELDAYEETP